ncbi:MAG: thioredoxin family protein [Oscillatoriales cyanobacterium SM2_1_8]|nr:thioredoxin family protein [Oscillatoriales cyanobacterium SM2_1_8]
MEIGAYAPDFELPSTGGDVVHLTKCLAKYTAVVVVFMCNHCPYVKAYKDRLIALQRDFAERGVLFVGINANDEEKYPEDGFEKMKAYGAEWGLNFPYLRDRTQDVAEAFGARCTPEPFLLDRQGILRYRGRIDDNYSNPDAVTRQDLREAIEAVLGDRELTQPVEPAIGCSVKWFA